MKKWFLINLMLTGVLVCLFLTSGKNSGEITYPYYTHHYEDGLLGKRYIVPEKYREYKETGGYVTVDCPPGLYFSCIAKSCEYPYEACPCVRGLEM